MRSRDGARGRGAIAEAVPREPLIQRAGARLSIIGIRNRFAVDGLRRGWTAEDEGLYFSKSMTSLSEKLSEPISRHTRDHTFTNLYHAHVSRLVDWML
jgi:hypothetical protein